MKAKKIASWTALSLIVITLAMGVFQLGTLYATWSPLAQVAKDQVVIAAKDAEIARHKQEIVELHKKISSQKAVISALRDMRTRQTASEIVSLVKPERGEILKALIKAVVVSFLIFALVKYYRGTRKRGHGREASFSS